MEHDSPLRTDVLAGRQSVLEALRAGRPINRVMLARDIGRHTTVAEILHLCREQHVPVDYAPREAIANAAGTDVHQGVIAHVAARDYVNLYDLAEESVRRGEPAFYMVLDGIEDPQNLGAIIRSADAAGVHGIITRARRAVGLTAAVSRASAGAVEYVQVARVSNISHAIETLKASGVWIVGIDPCGTVSYTQVDMRVPIAIVIGSEGKGISALVRRKCDSLAAIPMRGHVASLNASVAAALAMYAALGQRGW